MRARARAYRYIRMFHSGGKQRGLAADGCASTPIATHVAHPVTLMLCSCVCESRFGASLAMAAAKRRRKYADDRALEILKESRIITDADVVECLSKWRFQKNKSRANVIPVGDESVFSDTLGLVVNRVTKKSMLDAASKKNPNMLRLLAKWLRDRQPSTFKHSFPFTSTVDGDNAD